MTKPKSRRRRKWLVFGLIFIVLAGLATAALLRKKEPVISVQTEKVERRDLIETVVANGRIQPVQQVKISAEVSGEIIELPVKEGQQVEKGDLLVEIKPDIYVARVNSAEASYLSALASLSNSNASLRRAQLEFQRNKELFDGGLLSELDFLAIQTSHDIAKAQNEVSQHQVSVAKASLDQAKEELAMTTIAAPLAGTISQLNSELGEKVLGTAMNTGTEIMTIADLDQMEARVDIGEIDIILVEVGQGAKLEVDAFRDQEFRGTVTEIANSSRFSPGGQSQEAIKFEVKIRIDDKEQFRPGMSVTAEIETRSRTNVLTAPIQSVTTRMPKPSPPKGGGAGDAEDANVTETSTAGAGTNAPPSAGSSTNEAVLANTETNATEKAKADKEKGIKPIEVVFVVEGDRVKMVPVTRGISNNDYTEITEGLEEGVEIVSGGYRAISRDLEDGKKVVKGGPTMPGSNSP